MRRVSLARLADRRTPPQALRGLGVSIRYATVQSSQESLSLLGRAGWRELTWPYLHVGEPSPHVPDAKRGWARSLDAVAVVWPLVFSPSLSCLVLSTNCAGRKPQKLRHTRNKNVIIPVQKKKKRFFLEKMLNDRAY